MVARMFQLVVPVFQFLLRIGVLFPKLSQGTRLTPIRNRYSYVSLILNLEKKKCRKLADASRTNR